MRFSNSFGYAVKRRDAMGNLIPKEGLALLVMPGAQMIENSEKNKPFRPLVVGNENVGNSTFNDFTFDYPSIGEASPFYESDFSVDDDGWKVGYGTIQGNVDGIDGEDDVLKFWTSSDNSYHRIYHYNLLTEYGQYYKITGKVYIPSTNTTLKQVRVNYYDLSLGSMTITTLDSWTNFEVEIYDLFSVDKALRLDGLDGSGDISWTGAGTDTDDIFYVKDIKVQRVGMVAHWVFDDYYHAQEGTGKTALQDLTANAHDLTASAGFDWENQFTGSDPAYKNGNAEEFDGVDDELSIVGNDFIPYSNNFSVAFWFNTSVSDGQYHIIAETYNGATTNWQLMVEPTYNKLRAVFTGDVTSWSLFSTNPVNDGNWHLGVIVRSGTNLYLFVDGAQVASASIDIGSIKDINNLNIGNRSGSNYFFNGYLSEGAYFNRALSATEVKALAAKAYGWNWDETGDLAKDSNFHQIISGGGTLTQDVTTLDNTLYKEQLIGEGVNNVDYFGETTSHTITLTDGTWTSASVKEVTNVDEVPNFVEDFTDGGAKYEDITSEQLNNYSFDSDISDWGVANGMSLSWAVGGYAKIVTDGTNESYVYQIAPKELTGGIVYKYTIRFYVPSTNVTVSGLSINYNGVYFKYNFVTDVRDQFVILSGFVTSDGNGSVIGVYSIDSNGSNLNNTNGDWVYLDYIKIEEVTNGNHGLAQGGLETGQPIHPYSWEFDGVDDFIDFGDVLNIGSNDILIPVWFKTSSTVTYLPLIGKQEYTSSNGYYFYISGGRLKLNVSDGTTNYDYYFDDAGVDRRDGQWHYVVLVFKSGVWEVWCDNSLLDTWTSSVSSFNSTDHLLIGKFWAGYYEGKLGIISPYIFDGQGGRPSSLPADHESRYIIRIYNKTNKYFEE